MFRSATPEALVTRLDVVTPPTSEPYSFALSPDGRQLVFVANGDKGLQLWLRPFDQATAQPLAGTAALYPFWSPDGRSVAFFADAKLKRIDLPGSPPRVLADAPATRGGTWNREGIIVFSPTTTGGLMRVAATGGTPTAVTHLAEGRSVIAGRNSCPTGAGFSSTSPWESPKRSVSTLRHSMEAAPRACCRQTRQHFMPPPGIS